MPTGAPDPLPTQEEYGEIEYGGLPVGTKYLVRQHVSVSQ
jgi:hypothetical protein